MVIYLMFNSNINVIHFLIMEIKLFKLILNILIIPLMVVSLSMIVNGNIIGIIFFIVSILMSVIINGDNKHN